MPLRSIADTDHRGRQLKTDALHHHAGHDLVGCQDVAWDIVGVTVELGLSQTQRTGYAAKSRARRAAPSTRNCWRFLMPCCPALPMRDRGRATEIMGRAARR
jgi:hypothetical protein